MSAHGGQEFYTFAGMLVCHRLPAVAVDTPNSGVRYKNSYITDERHISRIGPDPVESSFVPASGTQDASIFIVFFFLAWPLVGQALSGWEFVHWQ
ncbi:hypothetical protein EC915_106211 [Pseudomonas sp. LP_7_YM]|nr:hypothetical protein EC915_106211 [Pseudomonas sp. LP_7_YM]